MEIKFPEKDELKKSMKQDIKNAISSYSANTVVDNIAVFSLLGLLIAENPPILT